MGTRQHTYSTYSTATYLIIRSQGNYNVQDPDGVQLPCTDYNFLRHDAEDRNPIFYDRPNLIPSKARTYILHKLN
jgi:hypothetical protein